MSITKQDCVGCDNDFYNGKNPLGVKRCWMLENAKPVTRYRIGWWTPPTAPGAFTKVHGASTTPETAPGDVPK